MRDPRASMPIIDKLDDTDGKVAARALFVLARLIWRYFPDQRAEPALLAKLAGDNHGELSSDLSRTELRLRSKIPFRSPIHAC